MLAEPSLLPLIVTSLVLRCIAGSEDGGWSVSTMYTGSEPCNIEIHEFEDLSNKEFLDRYAFTEPLIIRNFHLNDDFRDLCRRDKLISKFSNFPIHLNSANTYSYERKPSTLEEYVNNLLQPQDLHQLGNETWYLFGDIDPDLWNPLLKRYVEPPFKLPGLVGGLSFGIAGEGTGVPFHFHGPGFAEVIYGRKRWFLYPYEKRPEFDPNQNVLYWVTNNYTTLKPEKRPLECVLKPSDLIYFPDRWWHSTLNLETSVFVSTFLGPE